MARVVRLLIASTMAVSLLLPQPVHAAELPITPLARLKGIPAGRTVAVQGTLVEEITFRSGLRYVIEDRTGKATLVLFDRVLDRLDEETRRALGEGAVVRATGKLDFYQGDSQVVPARSTDLSILKPAPAAELRTSESFTLTDVGKRVRVSGQVRDTKSYPLGFQFVLADSTGTLTLTVPEKVFDRVPWSRQLNVGARVNAAGSLTLRDDGGWEVLVTAADGLRLIALAPPVERPVQSLGTLGLSQHGQVVRVVGEVVAIEKSGSALDALLRDESGAQFVRLWRVVAERAPVEVGMTIDVVGRVRLSRQRRLFVEPALPQDVTVVRLPGKQTS